MSENVSTVEVDLKDPTVAAIAFNDPDLSTLDVRSDEFKAALAEKAGKMNDDSASADAEVTEEEDKEELDTDDADDAESDDEQPQKKPRGLMKRVEKLVGERNALRTELETLRQRVEATQDAVAKEVVSDTFEQPKPKFADFDTLEDYTEALTEWKLDKREFDREQQKRVEVAKSEIQAVVQTWEEREAATKKVYRDYHTVVTPQAIAEVQPSDAARAFIIDSEVGPEVLYSILGDDEMAAKFADASPAKQVRMLAQLEADLAPAKEEKKATVSAAPQPPSRLGKGKPVATQKDLLRNSTEMSTDEWMKAFYAATSKKRK